SKPNAHFKHKKEHLDRDKPPNALQETESIRILQSVYFFVAQLLESTPVRNLLQRKFLTRWFPSSAPGAVGTKSALQQWPVAPSCQSQASDRHCRNLR